MKDSKSKSYKKNSEFLNSPKDSTQFWRRYHKVLGTKKDNVIEPLYENPLNTYIFKDEEISNILYNYHINKEKEDDKYDNFFKAKIKDELENILSVNVHDESYVFFDETHVKKAIRALNKNSSPGPDRITSVLIQNGGENFTKSLTVLLRNCFLLGYFSKCWKQDNRIYIKKPDKANCHLPNSYRSISLSNFLGKVYEKIIQQEAINVLTENNVFEGINIFAYQKIRNSSQALLPLIEEMSDAILSGKYGIAVMADLKGAFDTLWREANIYKLHKAGINNDLLPVFSSFLGDRYSKNLVNSPTSDRFQTTLGVPQGSILSPLIFLVLLNQRNPNMLMILSFGECRPTFFKLYLTWK